MKKIKLFIALCLMGMVLTVNASGDIKISEESITIKKGETGSFTINGDNVAGLIELLSENTNVATVNKNKVFFDSVEDDGDSVASLKVEVTGIEVGTTKVKVLLSDVATYDLEELSGERIININVVDSANSTPVPTPTTENTPAPTSPVKNTPTPTNSNVINNVPKTALNISLVIIIGSVILAIVGALIIISSKNKQSSR